MPRDTRPALKTNYKMVHKHHIYSLRLCGHTIVCHVATEYSSLTNSLLLLQRRMSVSLQPFACGPVYAELDFQPSQDEDKFEMTIKEPLTVYASIEEGHIL